MHRNDGVFPDLAVDRLHGSPINAFEPGLGYKSVSERVSLRLSLGGVGAC